MTNHNRAERGNDLANYRNYRCEKNRREKKKEGIFRFLKVFFFIFFILFFALFIIKKCFIFFNFFVWMQSPKLWLSSLLRWRSDINFLFFPESTNLIPKQRNASLLASAFPFPKPELLEFSLTRVVSLCSDLDFELIFHFHFVCAFYFWVSLCM